MIDRLAKYIPSSSDLEDDEFRARHQIILIGYAVAATVAFVVGLGFSIRDGDATVSHVGVELMLLVAPAVAMAVFTSRIGKQLLACTGILIASGLLVHGTNGLIEAHFSFFVMLPLIALYTDWRPFAYSTLYVAVTHGVLGTITPETMYNHEAAVNSPYVWGMIHAAFILALCAVMLVHWNFSDRKRLELRAAMNDLNHTQDELVEARKLESIGSLYDWVSNEIYTPIQFVGDNLEFISETATDLDRFISAWLRYQAKVGTGEPAAEALEELVQVSGEVDLEFALEEMPGAVTQSLEGVRRVADIVRAMKGFSHPKNEIVASDLNALISDTTVVSRSEWKYTAELSLDLADGLPLTPVPPGSFNQALLNLIINAAHAIEDGGDGSEGGPLGTITVTSRLAGDDMVSVAVSDTGCGIPEEIRAQVFEQFFTTKEVGRGTGQGLAIAQSLVVGLGGRIEVVSAVGAGTTFTIFLPIEQTQDAGAANQAQPDALLHAG